MKKYHITILLLTVILLSITACRKDKITETFEQEIVTPEIIAFEEVFTYTQYDVDEDFFIAEVTAQNPTATWDANSNTLVISGSDESGDNFMTYTVAGIMNLGEYYSTDLEGLMFGEINVLWCEEGHYGDIHDWCRSKVNLTTLDLVEGYVEGTFYCSTPDSNDDIVRMEGTFRIALD